MQFTQTALLFSRATFSFGDRELEYTIEDETIRVGFSVLYENIDLEKKLKSYVEKWPLYLLFLFLAAGTLAFVEAKARTPSVVSFAMIGLAGACALARHYARFTGTVLSTPLGNIVVFNRPGSQQIVDEIYRRRQSEMRRKYTEIDRFNDPRQEIAKFRSLKHQQIISEPEFNAAIATISVMHETSAAAQP